MAEDQAAEAEQARRDAEIKRRAEALAQQLEDDRKAELAAKQAAEDAKKKAMHEQMMDDLRRDAQQELAEKKIKAAEAERETASLHAKYQGIIVDKVTRNFRPPPGSLSSLACLVKIRLDRNGNLIEGRIIQSSGNYAYDRSCEAAIQKSAPFPMPHADPEAMRRLSVIEFEMKNNFR